MSAKVPSPFDLERFEKVPTPELKKGVEYALTGDFYPYGGFVVKLVKFYPAKETWPGTRGLAALVRSEDRSEFHIHPAAYLFREKPEQP